MIMKIKKIISQHRRDFNATLICENCEYEQELRGGYDDDFYHTKVIPSIKCGNCGEVAPTDYVANTPKYSQHEVV
jgi:uncharacterized Zn finger protein